MTFEFEYLGEFTFKFENFLDPETGSQMGSIDEKKLRSKISCKCTFKRKKNRQKLSISQKTSAELIIWVMYFSKNVVLCLFYASEQANA